MKMYVWESTALKNYAPGYIVVKASSLEGARAFALGQFRVWVREHKDWWFTKDGVDDDYMEDYSSLMQMFNADINQEPMTRTVLLIPGSN